MNFLQSQYWRTIKEKLGNKTYSSGNVWFQTTKVPGLNRYIGYVPRPKLSEIDWNQLYEEGKKANCVYISIDPDDLKVEGNRIQTEHTLHQGTPTHLQENVILDISKTEDELLAAMKQKHRYNLKLAQKKNVVVKISGEEAMFEEFLKLYAETVKRQNYYGRSEEYLRTVWESLKQETTEKPLSLIATAYFEGKPLSSWMLFLYGDTIYYPYGGSSEENKNVMATYSLVWELIRWGKQNGYTKVDLWGIEPGSDDGFSRFKLGFGGEYIVYADTIDLVIDSNLYSSIKAAFKLREKFKFTMKWF